MTRPDSGSIISNNHQVDWHQPFSDRGGRMPKHTLRLSYSTIVLSADVVERLPKYDSKLRISFGVDKNFHEIQVRATPTGYAMRLNPSGSATLNVKRLLPTFGIPIGDYYDGQGINTFKLIEKIKGNA